MPRWESLIRYSTVPWILILFCWLNSHAGVDHGQYLKWAEASVSGNIEALANEKNLRSDTGVPFSPWSAGPGLLIAPIYLLLMPFGLQGGAGIITGCLAVALFWLCFFQSMKLMTNAKTAALSCLLAAIGTPIGYYCCSISSEALSLAPTAFLMYQAVRGLKNRSIDVLGLLAATAMLLMIRPFLGVFAWPALAVGFCRANSRWRFTGAVVCTVLFAAIQIGMVNSWMTGSWMKTPYSFGDELFRSFDWGAPNLWHVLFDPFHGLVPTHPLVLVGILGLPVFAILAAKRQQWLACSFWSIYFVAVLLNIYFQSCWFYWWMATSSFGMRGLVLCSVPGILCLTEAIKLAHLPRERESVTNHHSSIAKKYLVGLILTAAFWGWLNLNAGPINQSSLAGLASVLQRQVENWFSYGGLIALVVSATLICSTRFFDHEHKRVLGLESPFGAIWFLTCAIFTRNLFEANWNLTFVAIMVGLWSALAVGLWSKRVFQIQLASRAIIFSVVMMGCFFSWLSANTTHTVHTTEQSQVGSQPPVFNWPDARRAYLTLLDIPRLENQRKAIRGFFERNFDAEFVDRNLPLSLPKTIESRPVVLDE